MAKAVGFRTTGTVKDWSKFEATFEEHGTSTTGPLLAKYEFASPRNAFCDETKTKLFRDVEDESGLAIFLADVDMGGLGAFMGGETYQKYVADADNEKVDPEAGNVLAPAGPDAPPVADMFAILAVKDFDVWYAGFKEHSTSKTGTWGFEVPITRSEFCDDAKTRVFRSVKDPNCVAIDMKQVDMSKLGPVLGDPDFNKITEVLGEIPDQKQMYYVVQA